MRAWVVFLVVILLAVVVSLAIPGVRKGLINLAVYGRLQVTDDPPTVDKIYIKDFTGAWKECITPEDCQKTITPDDTTTLEMKTQILDPNGDCDAEYTVNFYVCKNETGSTVCDETYADPDGGGPLSGTFVTGEKVGNYCNWTATYNIKYYKKWGNWYINVSAKDDQNPQWSSLTKKWLNVRYPSFSYPYPDGDGSTIELGTVNLDDWTYNRGENVTKNKGNVRLNMSWAATNFTAPVAPPNEIIIDDVNEKFLIDNDTTFGNGEGHFNAVPLTYIWWFPTGGVRRCGNLVCDTDEDGGTGIANKANYSVSYHIYVLSPKTGGIYNNTIYISANGCDPGDCGVGY